MPTKDRFDPEPLPLFLSDHADDQKQRGTSRILKAGILIVALTVGGVAIALSLGRPVKVFADATASLTDNSILKRGDNQSARTTQTVADAEPSQSPADVQSSAQAPGDTSFSDRMAGVPEPATQPQPAIQAQADNNEPASGALLKQFQAWAAKTDAKTDTKTDAQAADAQAADVQAPEPALARPPVQAAPPPVEDASAADDNPAPEQPARKPRKARPVQNARAEIRHVHKSRARFPQNAAAQAPVVQDARAQEQPVQPAPTPSFLQSLGIHQ